MSSVDGVSLKIMTEDIDQHLKEDAFRTHNPCSLVCLCHLSAQQLEHPISVWKVICWTPI